MHSASPLPRHHLVLAAATVLLVAMGLGACSKDGGDAPDGSSISGLLGAVPNTEDNRGYVVVNRYDAAAAGRRSTRRARTRPTRSWTGCSSSPRRPGSPGPG